MNHRLVDPLHKKESLIKSYQTLFHIKPIRIAWKFYEQSVYCFFPDMVVFLFRIRLMNVIAENPFLHLYIFIILL